MPCGDPVALPFSWFRVYISAHPLRTVRTAKLASRAKMAGTDDIISRIESFEISADHGEQPQIMSLAAGTIAVVLDPRGLGLYQVADFQGLFWQGRGLTEEVAVATELQLVRELGKFAATARGLEVRDDGSIGTRSYQIDHAQQRDAQAASRDRVQERRLQRRLDR